MTLNEIITKVKNLTGIDTDEVTTICQDHINDVQENDICSNIYGHDFTFLTSYGEISTEPVYETGTVAVTQDSTSITGTGTSWTSDMIGRYIRINDEEEYYEITAVDTTNQILTIKSPYIGATDSGLSYTIYKIFYRLASDFKKMKWVKQVVSPQRLMPIPEFTIAKFVPDEFTKTGEIKGYILSGQDNEGYTIIRFTPIPTTRKKVYYCYEKSLPELTQGTDESIIPSKWQMLLVYKLSEVVFRMHDMTSKANEMATQFEKKLQAFIREDKNRLKDETDIMQDEIIITRPPLPHLPYDKFGYY